MSKKWTTLGLHTEARWKTEGASRGDGTHQVLGWTSNAPCSDSAGRQCRWPFHSLTKAFQTIPSNIPSSILNSGVVKGLLKQGRSPRSAFGDTSEPRSVFGDTRGHQPSPEELVPGVAAAGGGVVTGFTPISSGQLNPGDPSQFSTPALALREGWGLLSWTEAQWGAPATPGKSPSTPTFGPSLHFFACLTSIPHRNRGRRATRIRFPHL